FLFDRKHTRVTRNKIDAATRRKGGTRPHINFDQDAARGNFNFKTTHSTMTAERPHDPRSGVRLMLDDIHIMGPHIKNGWTVFQTRSLDSQRTIIQKDLTVLYLYRDLARLTDKIKY